MGRSAQGGVTVKKFIQEFKAFALRGNVMDMAIGVLIGAAFSGIVTALTDNFINPLLQAFMKGQTYSMEEIAGFAGNFLTAVVNFFITALVLFCLLKAVNKMMSFGQKKEAPAAPTTKQCPYCCSEIPIAATRCPHCTSQLEDKPAA